MLPISCTTVCCNHLENHSIPLLRLTQWNSCLNVQLGFHSRAAPSIGNYPTFRQRFQVPSLEYMFSGWVFLHSYTFIVDMATGTFTETLDNSKCSEGLIPPNRNYTLNSSRENLETNCLNVVVWLFRERENNNQNLRVCYICAALFTPFSLGFHLYLTDLSIWSTHS